MLRRQAMDFSACAKVGVASKRATSPDATQNGSAFRHDITFQFSMLG